ncbi:MAG TPA: HAMP domain-containing sensor histidine kinase [Anaerolineae bacterium]
MLRSLRSRLLLSYFVVIVTALVVVAMAFFLIASQPSVRYIPALQRLDAISRTSLSELVRLREAGADTETFLYALQQTAEDNDVRIVIADARTRQVVFDTGPNNSWLAVTIEGVALPRRLLPTADPGTVAGLFPHPDGSTWLVYSRALSSRGFGRVLIFYAQQEPTRLAFFRELGLLNLLTAAGAIAFLLSILLAFAIAGSVARPLQKMANAAEAIARGDYDQQLPLQGPQEVHRVAGSFNSMAAQVAATRQAQRDFVANVSHDLKTPITSITGWSQALLDGTAVADEAQQQAAAIIHSEAQRMARMVEQLLYLARIESGQMQLSRQPVDLAPLLTDLCHNLRLRAQEQHVDLDVDLAPVPPVVGDPDRLLQIFTNLVDNALAHTPAGGRIRLRLRRHNQKALEVVVEDTGKGIATEELSRIFERFYQVDKSRARANSRRGSGLGLAIVRELVELHDGRIQVHSQIGEGSTFIVRLPLGSVDSGQ